jgi:AraC-like DNA-binding protein
MKTEIHASTVRRTLFDGELLQIGHVVVRPASSECGEIETSALNVVALPLAGVFAKHDGPNRHAIIAPNHAAFISAGRPYRLSFPGRIGDRCLVLRFSSAALARVMPDAMSGDGFDASAFASHAPLPPAVMLARSRIWGRFARDNMDALEAEELGIGLLDAALRAARTQRVAPGRGHAARGGAGRRLRQVERIKEAVWTQPERKWTLGDLAGLVSVSPCHLAHVFRAETGTPVYQYVVRSRLARALDAVLDSDTDLTAIALGAGFASHSHFTARFRALFGHTPLELRRGIRCARAHDLRKIVTARNAATA